MKTGQFVIVAGAGLLGAVPAFAWPVQPVLPGASGLSQPVQFRDAQVFYDGDGNRVIIDPDTGEVLAVRPPRWREGPNAGPRVSRERPARRDRYENDYPDDLPDDGSDIINEGPVDGSGGYRYRQRQVSPQDDARLYAPDEFPQAPAASGNRASRDRESSQPRRRDIERAPLPTPQQAQRPTSPPTETDEPAVAATEPQPERAAIEPVPETTVTSPADAKADPAAPPPLNFTAREDVAGLQILLDRAGSSPGAIDGKFGSNLDKALAAYDEITGSNLKSTDAVGIKAALAASGGDPFTTYTITPEDGAGPYVASIPEDYSAKAKLDRMSYTSVPEMLGERFHIDEAYLKAINPEANFSRPGTIIRVPNIGTGVTTPVHNIVADKGRKQVRAYDANGKLIAAFPATIGSSDTPSPTGIHAVSRIAFDPNYTYNPKVNFQQGDNDKVLTIPPGPNGPVGSIWIALDKPTYGIHGTPEPSKIGKTESHGCVRLTNWDATELAKLVSPGVLVEFEE